MSSSPSSPSPPTHAADGSPDRPDLDRWLAAARDWLESNLPRSDRPRSYAIFHSIDAAEERDLLEQAAAWQRRKFEAGYGAITWPVELGGAGLPLAYDTAFRTEEERLGAPAGTELVSVTLDLVAPTIREHGSPDQRAELLGRILRGEVWVCQLFSEPEAGSDLASLRCRADRVEGGWRVSGQKVWTSGAGFADVGELIARTDPDSTRHRGLSAFLIPLDLPGIEIRPIRQITGGGSFNEVFLSDVFVPDHMLLGQEGQGWEVTLTTLRHERASGGRGAANVGAQVADVVRAARRTGRSTDPVIRQQVADLWIGTRIQAMVAEQVRQRADAGTLGAEGSLLKLLWVANMQRASAAATSLLGPALVADTGAEDTYTWAEHVLGAPGYRIAGGSDEIQRNIIAERLLGLPREPR